MRVLFVTANRVGDAVLSTGLLSALLARYPEARFTIACGPAAAGVFARVPRLERLIVMEKARHDLHWPRLWWQVCRTRWALAVDVRGSALTFFIPAGERRIMRGGRRAGHRLTHLAAVLGLAPAPLPVAFMDAADRAVAARLIPDGAPAIGLGPTANWEGKVWPAERFARLFGALQRRLPGARAVVFGGPGAAEAALAAPLLAAVPGATDLVGRLTLAEAAACLARCALYVGNDSGLMHLAAAAGTPTLGLFGPSEPGEYAPSGRIAAFVKGGPAMADLTVEAALAACLPLLDRAAAAA